jgi:signal transduction histidine kinase
MIRASKMPLHVAPANRLGWMLVASYFGTVLFFVIASLTARYLERGIVHAAQSISNDALPSIQHLSATRTALRQMAVGIDDLTEGVDSGRRPDEVLTELQRARDSLHQEWASYETLSAYTGEEELQWRADEAYRSVEVSFDEALRRLNVADKSGARTARNRMAAPALESFDSVLHELLDLNTIRAAERSRSITDLRRQSQVWGFTLYALTVFFALVAGLLTIRVVRRFARVTTLRVSDLEHFAGRVAHDIRSPLSSVTLSLDLARKDPELNEKTRSRFERTERTVQRIGELVDGLLVFAVAGGPPPQGASASVETVLAGVIEGIAPRAEEKDIELSIEPAPDDVMVACSPGVLTSLLTNLVGNAVKYMGDSAVRKIVVRVRERGAMVRCDVVDTGPGVAPELRERIFDPYVRAATAGVAGLGLGLATVHRLVEAHGGSVGVDANPEGGSTFWFELPADHSSRSTSALRNPAGKRAM